MQNGRKLKCSEYIYQHNDGEISNFGGEGVFGRKYGPLHELINMRKMCFLQFAVVGKLLL
jgi:hypothetical protein